jgi:hypothetical protein
MPPEVPPTAGSSIQAWLGFLAPTLAVIVGFILTSLNARRIARKVESKVEETTKANSRKLDTIHKLVNGGRLGAALKKIDELETELYEARGRNPRESDHPDEADTRDRDDLGG